MTGGILVVVTEDTAGTWKVGDKDAAQHPTMHKTVSHSKSHLAQDVSSAEVRRPELMLTAQQ